MNKVSSVKLGAAILLALPLIGCGGGGGPGGNTTPTSTTMSVTPSLGQFQNATVKVIDSNGKPLGSGLIGADGSAQIDIGTYKGAVQVVIDGTDPVNKDAKYFDEAADNSNGGTGKWVAFGSNKLRALDPDVTRQSIVGVTPLTEVAAQYNDKVNGGAINKFTVDLANNFVAGSISQTDANGKTVPLISNILTAPVPVNDQTKQTVDAGPEAGRYAMVLAALAANEKKMARPLRMQQAILVRTFLTRK